MTGTHSVASAQHECKEETLQLSLSSAVSGMDVSWLPLPDILLLFLECCILISDLLSMIPCFSLQTIHGMGSPDLHL